MAATQRELAVQRDIESVWEFVQDMGNWASQMPGYISHEIIDDNDSVWTLNVDLGPFQRSIVVDVHVERWAAPSEVVFQVKGRYEPFTGGGTYRAERADTATHIHLDFHAEPGGSMAKMISPLVGPVLERIAEEFSGNLAAALGGAIAEPEPPAVELRTVRERGFFGRLAQRIAALLRPFRSCWRQT